jgi:hypothetical protein
MGNRELVEQANDLRYTLDVILREDLNCFGTVSLACCYDVVQHLQHDMDRLYAVHQTLVHPSKHVAYAAFWIRKLKPVDTSYHISVVEEAISNNEIIDESLEVRDINERICLYYALHLLKSYVIRNQVQAPINLSTDQFIANIEEAFPRFASEPEWGPVLPNRFEAIVYDMRFRTFGPHHVVHLVNYILREASHGSN